MRLRQLQGVLLSDRQGRQESRVPVDLDGLQFRPPDRLQIAGRVVVLKHVLINKGHRETELPCLETIG